MGYKQSGHIEQTRSEGMGYHRRSTRQSEINQIRNFVAERELRDIEATERYRKRLEEQGSGRYINIGAEYRLAYHKLSYNQETLSDFISLREEIINLIKNDNLSKNDLQSIYYGMIGKYGSRKISILIENLSPEEIVKIGYNDAMYLGVPKDEILSRNESYMNGYNEGQIMAVLNDDKPLDEVAQLLVEELEKKKSAKRK